ncbi:DUF502 domain-containing protein [Ponticaulis sp.]|uniref:DUF502 domain-containing protein n=1 Tax=Ponticaulis sp. TaxID=2020902 RepID=UPI000C4D5409|nr:DUF502 domain-containing protein [Ponticaulis sp.]MAJ08226.1 hypothetical protein [Ponticaulis sp.]MDF1681466.1 DUF502 domain-containing protein [Ponticaulis sp.]HBJ93054.1 hypothetical protein [Hyphomonadaceae bacterium]|tara:strand:- start:5452 stop:6201 length:750 start_codon:yes stop_codon:yes gene_type:complete
MKKSSHGNSHGEEHEKHPRHGFFGWLRARFFAGLVISIPIVVPLILVAVAVSWIDERLKPVLRSAIPQRVRDYDFGLFTVDTLIGYTPGLGVLFAVVLLTLLGAIAANLIGRSVIRTSEQLFERLPILRTLYMPLRQLVEIFSDKDSSSFKEVVLVEYPKEGTWAVGFLTSRSKDEIGAKLGQDFLGVFVPTTPNPTSGFLIYVPAEKVKHLSMSVEDGAKLIVSAGVVSPKHVEETDGEEPAPEADQT